MPRVRGGLPCFSPSPLLPRFDYTVGPGCALKKVVKSEAEWRTALSPDQFHVCRLKGTEPAFSGQYHDCKTPGIYKCSCCGSPLFSSEAKFDSGTGWPSFFQALDSTRVEMERDCSHGMIRTEVHCASCDAHLGHVFPDGPPPTGLRYCINSTSLTLAT